MATVMCERCGYLLDSEHTAPIHYQVCQGRKMLPRDCGGGTQSQRLAREQLDQQQQEQKCDMGHCDHLHHQLRAMASTIATMSEQLASHGRSHSLSSARWALNEAQRQLASDAAYFDPANE